MKKFTYLILMGLLAIGLTMPAAIPVSAASPTITLISSTTTQTAGYTITDPVAAPLNPNNYSAPAWQKSVVLVKGTSAHPSWVDPASDANFVGSGAQWISTTGASWGDENSYMGDSWRLYKATFTIPAGSVVTSGGIEVTSDNAFTVYLNDISTVVGTSGYVYGDAPSPYPTPSTFEKVYSYSFTPLVGNNALYFVVRNWPNIGYRNPTGLLYKAVIQYRKPTPKEIDPATLTTLTINTAGQGTVTGAGPFASGTVVSVSATPASGWQFVNWTGDAVANSSSASTTIIMNGNKTITANFTQIPLNQLSIVVLTPNGGETWIVGSKQVITWKMEGLTGYLQIDVLKAGIWVKTLASRVTASEASYTWLIPDSWGPSSEYSINISSVSNPGISDTSDGNFTINLKPPRK